MAHTIVESSPQALAKIKSYEDAIGIVTTPPHHRTIYPFDLLHIGKSFTLPIEGTNETSVRMVAHGHGKKRGKKFTVIKHRDHSLIEVARIA